MHIWDSACFSAPRAESAPLRKAKRCANVLTHCWQVYRPRSRVARAQNRAHRADSPGCDVRVRALVAGASARRVSRTLPTPQVAVQLQLTEQLPDLTRYGFDGAIWLWSGHGAQASQWWSRPLARNQRVLVASPSYLKQHGQPRSLDIAPQLAGGQLMRILPAWSMPDADIHWLAPYRAEVPRRIRLLIDFLRAEFETEHWRSTLSEACPSAPPG